MKHLSLSLVVPVYSGANYLTDLISETAKLRVQIEEEQFPIRIFEALFVVDDAVDNSAAILDGLKLKHNWIRTVVLSRNYGQHPATIAGIMHASGDWIVTMDEDLQHHPQHITKLLLTAIMKDCDIVYAHPERAVHGSILRDRGSKWFKWIISKLTGDPNITRFNSFRLIRGDIARATAAVAINQTYFDVALSWFSTRVSTVTLPLTDRRFKKENQSGYSIKSLLSHSYRMIQTSNLKIMRLGALLGFMSMVLAALFAVYTLIVKYFFPEIITMDGWATIIVSIMFLGGLNAFIVSLVLENIAIILMRNHGKPTFFEIDRSSDIVLRRFFQKREEQ